MLNFYKFLFTSAYLVNFDPILQGIAAKVTPLMNAELTREFTVVKVKQALKQMKTITALGPDGRLSHGEREREREF